MGDETDVLLRELVKVAREANLALATCVGTLFRIVGERRLETEISKHIQETATSANEAGWALATVLTRCGKRKTP